MALGFFDGDTRNSSPEAVKRKRDLIARILTGRAPRSVGEGLNAIGDGLLAAVAGSRANAAEAAGMEEARRLQSAAFGGMGAPAPMASPAGGSGPVAAAAPVDLAPLFAQKEQAYGLPSGYLARTAQIESSFNPNAKNPNSSATGLFQFINSTARQYGLDNPRDPVASTAAAARLAADNRAHLQRVLGREPTAGELYLAHQQGAGGAARLLANPNAPVESIVGAEAARLNGGRPGMTASAFAQRWTGKFGSDQGDGMGGMPDAGASDAAAVDMGAPVPVPVAETEADVQALEAQMAPQMAGPDMAALFAPQAMGAPSAFMPAGAPAPVEAPPPQMDRATFDAITATQGPAQPAFMAQGVAPSWGGQNADLPAQGAAVASLPGQAIPQPPTRPANLGPQSAFVPPQMRQPMPDVTQGTEQGGVGMYDALTPPQAAQVAQATAGVPMAAQMAPQAPANVGASGAASQAAPASGNSNANIAALLASPFVSREVKQFALAELQQRQAMQMQEAERARARGDSEAAARAAGLDPALVGDKTILGQAAQARFNRLNNQPKRSLQPVFATDAQGNTVMLQPGEDGTAVQTKMPEGVKIASGVDKVDAGTEFILIDKRTGNVVGRQPKDIAGAARQKVLGKDEGERITNAPGEIRVADQALATINQIRTHKGRDGLGAQGGTASLPWINRGIPGTEGRDFVALVEQAQGQAFLQAFESLKGGGQITQTEGEKATQAIARLDRTQSREGFNTALKDIEGMLRLARDRAQRRVRVLPDGTEVPMGNSPAAAGTQQAPPDVGSALQRARDAIAKGADRQAVIDRLRQGGIDPGGL